jgi:hypothetical protein
MVSSLVYLKVTSKSLHVAMDVKAASLWSLKRTFQSYSHLHNPFHYTVLCYTSQPFGLKMAAIQKVFQPNTIYTSCNIILPAWLSRGNTSKYYLPNAVLPNRKQHMCASPRRSSQSYPRHSVPERSVARTGCFTLRKRAPLPNVPENEMENNQLTAAAKAWSA